MKFLPTLTFYLIVAVISANTSAQTFESGEDKATLIELYTSEGCSSCPPADEWLSKLKTHPELWSKIVPVAFHVDYWDWIGWKDDFAKPEFSKRQKRYKTLRNTRSVYTPGFFVNGYEWRDFFRSRKAKPPIGNTKAGKLRVVIEDGKITASFHPLPNTKKPKELQLNVAELSFNQSNFIKFGENIGKTLNHDFVVNRLTSLTLKRSEGSYKITSSLPSFNQQTSGLAIWISDPATGESFQATGGILKSN